jgi:hypothetical protein
MQSKVKGKKKAPGKEGMVDRLLGAAQEVPTP